MDIRLALMCGTDIPIPECQIVIHQPTIKEIALIGERDFFTAIQCLCVDKSIIAEGNVLLQNTNNFQIFMTIMNEKEALDKKESVQSLFPIIFPGCNVLLSPRAIIIQTPQGAVLLDESNFEIFQSYLREIFCLNSITKDDQKFNPANAKAKEIAEKIMRGRKRVAELKGEDNVSIFSQYLSILTVGLNAMSLQDCMNLTMYQIYDLIERYQLYINWDLDIRSRMAGAKIDSQPDNWMKNIHQYNL